jgi:cbb3-type cytochrome oxidase cytochrome c subunit
MTTEDKPMHMIVNCETHEVTYVPFTDEEIAQKEADYQAELAQKQQALVEAEAKEQNKTSAIAKLTALGLTEEEAATIVL